MLADGIWMLVTNITETIETEEYRLKPEELICVYTICILSYLLDLTITNRLRQKPIEGVRSVEKVHRILRKCEVGKLSVKGSDCDYLVRRDFLKSIGVLV